MRGAVIAKIAALVLLAVTGACEAPDAKPKAEPEAAFVPDPTAVNASDSFCLDPAVLRGEPSDREAIWARYHHWTLCDYDARKANQYLDTLVGSEDPGALVVKSMQVRDHDPDESALLLRRARELGWRRHVRQDERNELATPPS